MRISDWSSDVCSSDLNALLGVSQRQCAKGAAPPFSSRFPRPSQSCAYSDGFGLAPIAPEQFQSRAPRRAAYSRPEREHPSARLRHDHEAHRHSQTQEARSEEHTSELQSLMRISYAVFCLK